MLPYIPCCWGLPGSSLVDVMELHIVIVACGDHGCRLRPAIP